VPTREVHRIVFNVRSDLADMEGIIDRRKSTVHCQVKCVVVLLLVDVLDAERSDPCRFKFPRCVQEVDVLYGKKNLLAG